uniref:Thioredoxin domain-containing protein n=1 Tax=Haptolina brevifila TaxID=156173 RepID=A0A7S2N8J1_9EUKA|mmetsp:Transcript_69961/g.138689  ORF Transcript_69961/g.138689 Transcript_69961/m.138689 type:complete len:161 (+) Transcript_69961:187-669(+)
MKPDWDSLANDFKDSASVIIADVDCTAAGEPLCKKHGVSGYPTIKTFAPGADEGDAYEGGRDLESLRKHAESLGPSCSIDNKDLCSAEDLAKIEKYAAMSPERRTAKLNKLKNAIKKKEHEHEKLQKELQARYEASNSMLEKIKEEYKQPIKLMTAATPK